MEPIDIDERRKWREYCGVVQLTQQQFFDIQNTLLAEQLQIVAKNPWFKSFVGGEPPKSLEEFRRVVPLRSWPDYLNILTPENLNGNTNELRCWVHTSWCHGSWKQVPWTKRFYDAQCRHAIAALMMAVARYEGDVRLNKDFKVLPILPDTPFASAWLASGVVQRNMVSSRLDPSQLGANVSMLQKLQLGLWRGMELGVDCVVGMASTLLMTRREFERLVKKATFRQFLSQAGPKTALRWKLNKLTRLGRNSNWEPKSLLAPKAVVTWGADTAHFTPMLEAQWGASVFEMYASSEGGIIAMQDWRRKGLLPVPTSVYMEFLPAGTVPDSDATILMDKLEEGGLYEPVITSFYGMPYLRLRQGDLLQMVGRNEKGIPQFKYHSRADDIIDLGSIARINGETLKEALAEVGVPEGQWAARKEYLDGGRPVMSIYVDVEPETAKELQWKLHRAIGKIDPHYREASFTLGYTLLRISPTKQEAMAVNGSHASSSE